MDGSLVLPLVVGLVAGLVVGVVPLLRVVRGHLVLRAAIGESSRPGTVPDPDELSPNTLAFLVGGPVRVGETAIVDAFLSERIRSQAAKGFFTLVGPNKPYAHEKDPVRRVLVKAFKKRVGVSARELVRRVVTGRGIKQLRQELAQARLIVDSREVRAVLETRKRLPRTIRGGQILSLLVAGAGAGVLFLVEPVGAAVVALAGGLAASALLLVANAVLGATGGPAVLPTTAAGDEVVERARERYGVAPVGSGGRMPRDEAVRHTAVTGFRALRGRAGARRSTGPVSADESPALTAVNAGAGGHGDAGGGEGLVDPDALCELADLCQGGSSNDSGPGSGGGSGDGWNGGFGDTGDSGSGGGWGGWGGGGDSGGDSGGGGGDGGGGGGGD
ncbi:TIGR04222 domain-containing membrane protein [Nocardiopsis sp. NPDC058631]|uniref:TIGR04222 domain-containing membrane protein n=1 Tax=Nocardiopsis sp. NPDC058631 TaxID=3346566 RepID=UPI003669BBC3